MSSFSSTSFNETQFVVLCFPGDWSWWKGLLGAVLLLMFFVALFANLSLLLVIWTERRFHTPMYYFVCCLSNVDFGVSFVIVPIVLAGLLFDLKTIDASTCFLQIFIICWLVTTQSGVLMLMAYDRYVAICKPLQYPLIISNNFVIKAIVALFIRSTVVQLPATILPAELDYCHGNIIQNCYCNSLEVSVLACDSTPLIGMYNIAIMFLTTFCEIIFIMFSYFKIFQAVFRLQSRGASSKAFNTCGSHFIVISYFYSSEMVLVTANIHADRIPSGISTLMAILFCIIPSVINPLVYGFRTKGFIQIIMGKLKMSI